MSDPVKLQAAMQSVSACLVLSPVDPQQCQLQDNIVSAALAEGDVYIVKISGLGTALDSYVDSGRWHAETEQKIIRSGLPHTLLRPLFFMQNLGFQLQSARADGLIRSAVTRHPINMVDADDIGDVVAELLSSRSKLLGEAVPLTGPEPLSYVQMAEIFSQVLQRPVVFQEQTFAEVEQALQQSDQPTWHTRILMQFNRALNEGWGDVTLPIVNQVLGRQPRSFLSYLTRVTSEKPTDQGRDPFPS